jgi:hypothetical protein
LQFYLRNFIYIIHNALVCNIFYRRSVLYIIQMQKKCLKMSNDMKVVVSRCIAIKQWVLTYIPTFLREWNFQMFLSQKRIVYCRFAELIHSNLYVKMQKDTTSIRLGLIDTVIYFFFRTLFSNWYSIKTLIRVHCLRYPQIRRLPCYSQYLIPLELTQRCLACYWSYALRCQICNSGTLHR